MATTVARAEKNVSNGRYVFSKPVVERCPVLNEKMKKLYDQFSARITVDEIVNHIESKFRMTQYEDTDAEWLIVDYLQYNFFTYIGQPIVYSG